MRYRKTREWLIRLIRVEVGQDFPLAYDKNGKLRQCLSIGTTYSYAMKDKRQWLKKCVMVRYYPRKYVAYRVHTRINDIAEMSSIDWSNKAMADWSTNCNSN